jgi:hypothetical protein
MTKHMTATAMVMLLFAGQRLPAQRLFKVGITQRAFVPQEPYSRR